MPPTTKYRRGDVVLVDIAFSGAIVGRTRRPAVVISSERFNAAGTKLIVSAITGNIAPPFRPGDLLLTDWEKAGLLKESSVRGIIVTVDKQDVDRTLGSLSTSDIALVDNSIAVILGIERVPS